MATEDTWSMKILGGRVKIWASSNFKTNCIKIEAAENSAQSQHSTHPESMLSTPKANPPNAPNTQSQHSTHPKPTPRVTLPTLRANTLHTQNHTLHTQLYFQHPDQEGNNSIQIIIMILLNNVKAQMRLPWNSFIFALL